MPGVSVLVDERGGKGRLVDACRTVEHDERYRTSVLAESDDRSITVAESAYPAYPVRRVPIDVPGMTCVLDGRVYDRSEAKLRTFLGRLGRSFDEGGDRFGSDLPAWAVSRLAGMDGEFVLVFLDSARGIATVISDPLGRLPVYLGTHEEGVCVSREFRVAADAGGHDREYDRLGIAQQLCFGHPLGSRSLLRGVRKPRPAAWLTVDSDGLTERQYHTLDLEATAHADRSRKRNAAQLARLFERACETRLASAERPVLSLSGGLDSRSVLGGMAAAGITFETATMVGDRVAAADVSAARELAALYDVPWTSVSLEPRSGSELSRYTTLRSGRVTVSNADIVTFFDRLRSEFGSLTYVTGDGGDKLLPDPSPASDVFDRLLDREADATETASFIIEQQARLPPADATAVAEVPSGAIHDSLLDRIESYPESGSDAHVRFLFAERAYNLLFEAEERNRCWFWATTPFYSLPFVRYAMNVPRRQKQYYRLYGAFLRALSPDGRLLSVRNPAFNARPDTARHAITAAAYRVLQRYPAVLERVLPVVRSAFGITEETGRTAVDARTIYEQVENSEAIQRVLDLPALRRGLDGQREYDRQEVLTIMTITALVDERSKGESTLEENSDRLFD